MRTMMLSLCLLASTSWASDATEQAAQVVAAMDASTVTHFESVPARATRAGWLRIVDDALVSASGAPWLIHQLATSQAPTELRVAWADALVRAVRNDPQAFGWGQAWVDLATTDRDSKVRGLLLAGLRHGAASFAVPALVTGLSHEDASTRAAAADGLAWHTDGLKAASSLRLALSDEDAEVRRLAATAVGYLGDAEALEGLVGLLDDQEPLVQAAALRALERVAPRESKSLPEVQALAEHPHTQVQRAAVHLLQSGS